MSAISIKVGRKKQSEKRQSLMESLWDKETLEGTPIWNRLKQDGYTTLPRTMPQIHAIMDALAEKGKPLSGVYLSLWCNVFDEGFLEVKDKERFAFEAGFSGQRAVTTWLIRMKKLEELGFIKSKEGASGPFNYLLLVNPLSVIKKVYETRQKDQLYNALIGRMSEVGAKFDEEVAK